MANGKARAHSSLIEQLLKSRRGREGSVRPAAVRAAEYNDAQVADSSRHKERILVLDDSDTARAMICETLRHAGYEVLELPSAIGATRVIQRSNVRLVVVDVHMPGLSGDSLVEVLRMHPRFRELVIIVVSGSTAQDLETLCKQCGADEALTKRDVSDTLVPAVTRLLRGARAARRELGE